MQAVSGRPGRRGGLPTLPPGGVIARQGSSRLEWTSYGCYHAGKEPPTIELPEQQAEAVARAEQLPLVVDPRTREEFIPLRRDRFDAMQKWMASLKRRWDDPADDDLIRKS